MIIVSSEESILLLAPMREVEHFGGTLCHHLRKESRDPAIVQHMVRLQFSNRCQERLRRLVQSAGAFKMTFSDGLTVVVLYHTPGAFRWFADYDIAQSNISFFARHSPSDAHHQAKSY